MEAENTNPYRLRPYSQDDIPFIQSSWGSSYYGGINYRAMLGPDEFHHFHRPIRDRFFKRPDSAVIVCCAVEDPKLIMSWMAVERPNGTEMMIIHYIYTKEAFKNEGLATKLLSSLNATREIFYSHSTEKIEKIINRSWPKYEKLQFAPHLC